MDYGSILEVLWESLLPPHAWKQLCQFFSAIGSPPALFMDFSSNCICIWCFTRRQMLNYFPCFCDVGTSSSRTLHSICGSLLIVLSLTDVGRLNTPLKCSAHLSKIASLSVRSVLPSALSSWWHQKFWAINCFQCIMELLHILPGRPPWPSG